MSDEFVEPLTETPELPPALPVLPLKETVVFPESMTPLAIGQERSIKLIDDVAAGELKEREGDDVRRPDDRAGFQQSAGRITVSLPPLIRCDASRAVAHSALMTSTEISPIESARSGAVRRSILPGSPAI